MREIWLRAEMKWLDSNLADFIYPNFHTIRREKDHRLWNSRLYQTWCVCATTAADGLLSATIEQFGGSVWKNTLWSDLWHSRLPSAIVAQIRVAYGPYDNWSRYLRPATTIWGIAVVSYSQACRFRSTSLYLSFIVICPSLVAGFTHTVRGGRGLPNSQFSIGFANSKKSIWSRLSWVALSVCCLHRSLVPKSNSSNNHSG